MILIVDLCWKKDSLSGPEFTGPVVNIVRNTGESFKIVHHTEVSPAVMEGTCGVILCGTALKDNAFRKNSSLGELIRQTELPVLGICAGMQAIALAFGGDLIESPGIGMTRIWVTSKDEIFGGREDLEAYELHGAGIQDCGDLYTIAKSDTGAEAFRHRSRPVWGLLFHPEVRNEWAVENFIEYCRRSLREDP